MGKYATHPKADAPRIGCFPGTRHHLYKRCNGTICTNTLPRSTVAEVSLGRRENDEHFW
jgi:hypothetical protein